MDLSKKKKQKNPSETPILSKYPGRDPPGAFATLQVMLSSLFCISTFAVNLLSWSEFFLPYLWRKYIKKEKGQNDEKDNIYFSLT